MPDSNRAGSGVGFPETLWSVVSRAGHGSRRALETLADGYRAPVLKLVSWFLKARRFTSHDPEDVSQDFFIHLLTHRTAIFGRADRNRGRFRAWFRTCLSNWLRTWSDEVRAKKRGGGARVASLDDDEAKQWEPAAVEASVEREFDRQWAKHVLDEAFRKLKEDERTGALEPGDFEIFRAKHVEEAPSGKDVAVLLGKDLNAVVVSLRRTSRRLKEHLKAALVAGTATEEDLNREIKDLLAAMSP
ncbi:MAG: hypothetical protein FD180_3679 [Planctomycetota bacterium]|nr:MAG: hypothetical protein FD180_3679 [Planctomycetota bacterium]